MFYRVKKSHVFWDLFMEGSYQSYIIDRVIWELSCCIFYFLSSIFFITKLLYMIILSVLVFGLLTYRGRFSQVM